VLEANLSPGPHPVPLWERVESLWVSLLGLSFAHLCQSPLLNISIPMQGLSRASDAPRWVSLPEDVARREDHRVWSE
jgi:hypothetical protein